MSRIGAKKNRENREWVYIPRPNTPEPKKVWEEVSEEQAKVLCGLIVFFTKLSGKIPSYETCAEECCKLPMGSYRYTFWWSLRFFHEHRDWNEFEAYFNWKLSEFRDGHCASDGILW